MAEETKFVKITDVRGYTPEDSVRTLYPGFIYEVEEAAAKDIVASGRGSVASGKQTEKAIRIGLAASADISLGGDGGSSFTADAGEAKAEANASNDKKGGK